MGFIFYRGNATNIQNAEKVFHTANTIRLTPEDVKHFVDVASKCDFDIDICYNRYVIDAKSFLGVYGLDFTKPLTVSYDGYNDKFEEMLKQCAIAC